MSRSAPQIILLLVTLIYLRGNLGSNSGVEEPTIRCKEAERQALLRIKKDLYVSSFWSNEEVDVRVLLSSWGEEEEKRECCEWIGIRCDNKSGHVISLDLSPSTFDTQNYSLEVDLISSSLVELKYLNRLDLSDTYFGENCLIPSFIGSLSKLRYLNLSRTSLGGEIPPQLGNLSNLQFLDLSDNDGLNIKTLKWVLRLSSLRILQLSGTNMSLANDWVHVVNNLPLFLTNLQLEECNLPDIVPPSLSPFNSSKILRVLDISYNSLSESVFRWLFNYNHSLVHLDLSGCLSGGSIPNGFENMALLTYLDLHSNDFEGFIPNFFRNMTSLAFLDLSHNLLKGSIPKSFQNMTSLAFLDLSDNLLKGSIPKSFQNMTSLAFLDLSYNHLKGSIPEDFGNMASLGHLDLSNNMLEGDIPKSIWKICELRSFGAYNNSLSGELHFAESSSGSCANFSLEYLDLKQNRIMGSLPNFTLYPSLLELHLSSNQFTGISKSIGQLSHLEVLDISENSIKGVISEAHFSKLYNLLSLDLSMNLDLVLKIPLNWIPPFQLEFISLGSCKLGPHFPKWLQTQKNYYELNISNSRISDTTPDWLWDFNRDLKLLDLSNNEIRGNVRDIGQSLNFSYQYPHIDLSSNQFEGSIPHFLLQTPSLNLFNNNFSQLNSLCNFTEKIPLVFLDVSHNQLSGQLPDCWSHASSLRILILENNKLSGKIPISIGFLISIEILHLGHNNLTAELPSSLQNCTELMVFDAGENNLLGPIPAWIGTSLTELIVLSLRANNFSGSIPLQLCHLVDLQVLDLSSNDLSSKIPMCLGNITAMKEIGSKDAAISYSYAAIILINEKLVLVWKGAISKFKNLGLLKNIDLSSNKLIGEIPRDITKLVELIALNLSRNHLSGHIPQEIGRLKSLDVLDLSNNHFFGQIPSSLSQVDRLNTLDLSNNNLSGKIPTGTQLQTRDAAAFVGNPELCGDPLPKKCPNEEEPTISNGVAEDGDKDEFIATGFYISIALGFVVGFWGVCGTLIFNKSWRYAYFRLLNHAGDWVHVTAAVHKGKLLRMIKR